MNSFKCSPLVKCLGLGCKGFTLDMPVCSAIPTGWLSVDHSLPGTLAVWANVPKPQRQNHSVNPPQANCWEHLLLSCGPTDIHPQPADPQRLENTWIIGCRNGPNSATADTKMQNNIMGFFFIKTGKRVLTLTISCSSGLLRENYKSFWGKISSDACSLPPWDVSIFISKAIVIFYKAYVLAQKCILMLPEKEQVRSSPVILSVSRKQIHRISGRHFRKVQNTNTGM